MKLFLTIAALAFTGVTMAQDQDPKAKTILDELSKKTKAYSTIQVEFTMKTTNKTSGTNETVKGTATMKGSKYIIDLGKQKVLCDGVKVWTLLMKEKECTEETVEDNSDATTNPTKLLTIWEKGFKYRFVKEEGGMQEIHLFPTDTKKSKYHTVILKIDKAKEQVKTVTVKGKNGDVIELDVTKFTPNVQVEDAKFKFSKKDYPDFTVID
ncbi:MAG TPA: outer membrane lipoprotein carrier protein LolA [Flavobacteriales bacterium]|nr:outer membrane lipoprotein carrier protein LolA [Flavobacteriales bacterium]